MANELYHYTLSTDTVRRRIWNAIGQIWNGTAFENHTLANEATYLASLTMATLTGTPTKEVQFRGDFPITIAAGIYLIEYYLNSDSAAVARGQIDWTGTAERTLSIDSSGRVTANVTQIAGQTVNAAAAVTFPAIVGNSTFAGGAVASVTAAVTLTTDAVNGASLAPDAVAEIAAAILVTAANKITTDATGRVNLNLTQAVPTTNTAETVGDALNSARASGFGKWVKTGVAFTGYAADGTTVVKTFTLDDATTPTSRT